MDRIKAAFVGCGGICNFHLSHLVQFDDVDYVGFMDIRPERAREKAAQVGGAPVLTTIARCWTRQAGCALYLRAAGPARHH
jgi:predicted dehydrogenase